MEFYEKFYESTFFDTLSENFFGEWPFRKYFMRTNFRWYQ